MKMGYDGIRSCLSPLENLGCDHPLSCAYSSAGAMTPARESRAGVFAILAWYIHRQNQKPMPTVMCRKIQRNSRKGEASMNRTTCKGF